MKYCLMALLILSGCSGEIHSSLVTTVDGCNVYRIGNSWDAIYTTTCQGSVSWSKHEGKVTKHVRVETNLK